MGLAQAALKTLCYLPIRGRHRLIESVGKGGMTTLQIGQITLPLDLAESSQRYVYYGLYEGAFVAHLKATLRPGDVMIDPGANIGFISAVAAELVGPQGKVIAIEPSRTCHARLTSYLNAPNIELLHAALNDKAEPSRFCDTPRVITRGFACLASYEEPEDATAYDIDCVTVDGICEARAIKRLRYLKLDVEGAELAALHGAQQMLASASIDYILVESMFGDAITEGATKLLKGKGYRPFKPDSKGRLHPLAEDQERGRFDVIWRSPRANA